MKVILSTDLKSKDFSNKTKTYVICGSYVTYT